MARRILITRFVLRIMVGTCITLLSGCAPVPGQRPARTPGLIYQSSSSEIAASSLQNLIATSDVIVLASVMKVKEVVNTSRNSEEISQPSLDSFSIGQVYQLDVSRYLKGSGPRTVLFVQDQGMIPIFDSRTPSPEDIDQEVERNRGVEFENLALGSQRYLMFLRKPRLSYQEGPYRSTDLFSPASNPWLYDASDLPNLALISTLQLSARFNLNSLEQVISTIASTPAPTQSPTPNPYPSPPSPYP